MTCPTCGGPLSCSGCRGFTVHHTCGQEPDAVRDRIAQLEARNAECEAGREQLRRQVDDGLDRENALKRQMKKAIDVGVLTAKVGDELRAAQLAAEARVKELEQANKEYDETETESYRRVEEAEARAERMRLGLLMITKFGTSAYKGPSPQSLARSVLALDTDQEREADTQAENDPRGD